MQKIINEKLVYIYQEFSFDKKQKQIRNKIKDHSIGLSILFDYLYFLFKLIFIYLNPFYNLFV